MKKLFFFLAALTLSFTAQATVVECNPGTNNLAWYLTQGDTLVLADGLYEEAYEIAFNTPGVYVKAAEGAKPVISLTQEGTEFQLKASVTFDGITFDGNNVAQFIATFSEVSVEQFSFVNCEFKNYTQYAISDGWYDGCHIGSLLIDNCIFHDGGSAVSIGQLGYDGKVPFDSFKLTNSTIYNVKMSDYAGIVNIFALGEGETEEGEVVIDHVTIYNFDASSLGAISVRKNKNLKISNSIIATPEDKGQRALYVYNGTVDNTLYYNASKRSGNTVYTDCINEDPLFVDAANGNFALAEGSPALGAGTDGSNLGDPRWNTTAGDDDNTGGDNTGDDNQDTEQEIIPGTVINVEPGKGTLQAAVDAANVNDTLILTTGEYELGYISGGLVLGKEGLVLKAATGENPVIAYTDPGATLKIEASVTFDGIVFDGGDTGVGFPITIYESSVENIDVLNCEFKNYSNFAISDQWSKGCHIGSLRINNCLFHDGGQAVVLSKYGFEEKHPCDYFEIKNSTIYNIAHNEYKSVIHISAFNDATGTPNKVVIDHLTIWNYDLVNGNAAIEIRKTSDLTITNTIIGNPETRKAATYLYGGAVSNMINFNATLDSDANNTNCSSNDPLFVDAANGNFALAEGSPALGAGTDGSNLGDPRWNAPAVEEPTYDMEITCTNLKTVSEGNMTHFMGADSDGMEIDLIVFGFNGAGTYEGVEGSLNAGGTYFQFTGTAEYAASAVEGTETNVLTAILTLSNGMTVKLTMYNLNAGDTDEPGTPGETITVEMYDATFTVEDGIFYIEAEDDNHNIFLYIEPWNGYGDYEAYTVMGFVDDVEVSNLTEGASVEKDGLVATLYVVLTDGTNTYNVIVSGMAPAEAGDDDEPVEPNATITITANNLTASVPYAGVLLLKANANDVDNTQIFLWLQGGDKKGYGDYGYSETESGIWPDVDNASYGDVYLTLSKETPAKYYQDGTVDVFEGTFLGDDNNLYILVLRSEAPTVGLENLDTTVTPAKAIVNGQLVIIKNGVQYNATGAVVK